MENQAKVIFSQKPVLRQPYIICGLNGWVNGGDVATGGIKYLIRNLRARKFAEIPIAHYHVYQIPGIDSLRPIVRMEDGLVAGYYPPRNQFFFADNPASDHDVILFLGTEPNMNWDDYAEAVAGLASEYRSAGVYFLGGVLDKTPHTRQPRVSCSVTSAAMREEMKKYNVTFSNREGPTTFNTVALYYCQKHGVEGASFSVRATYYPEFNIAVPYNPKSVKALLVRLNYRMNLNLNFDALNSQIRDFEGKLEFMRSQSREFNTYVEELEKNYTEMPFEEPLELSPDEAVRLAEDLLRRNREEH